MAGSFGYKTGYYEISASLGQQLAKQIEKVVDGGMDTVVLASGTSCTEQIHDFTHTKPIHPLVWLESILH
jgi:Fe-S oxidoreductase